MNKGFTLIELSVVMTIVALLLSFSLAAFTSVHDSQAAKLNREKIQMVQDAIEAYLEEYGHLPCVADRSKKPIDNTFGESFVASNDPCTGGASLPAHKQITTAGDPVWIGGVPVRDLGIPENLAYDAYGNRFTYVVTEGYTDPATYAATDGEIIVNNAAGQPVNTSGTIAYTLISHGKSGAGAYKHKTGEIGRACNLTTEDSKNCDDADVEFIDIARNTGTVIANFFDDKIVWKVNTDAGPPPTPTFNGFTGYKFKEGQCNNTCDTSSLLYDIGYPEPGNPGNIQNWYQGDNASVTVPLGINIIEIKLQGQMATHGFWWVMGCLIRNSSNTNIGERMLASEPSLDGEVETFHYRESTSLVAVSSLNPDREVRISCNKGNSFSAEFRGVDCKDCK